MVSSDSLFDLIYNLHQLDPLALYLHLVLEQQQHAAAVRLGFCDNILSVILQRPHVVCDSDLPNTT